MYPRSRIYTQVNSGVDKIHLITTPFSGEKQHVGGKFRSFAAINDRPSRFFVCKIIHIYFLWYQTSNDSNIYQIQVRCAVVSVLENVIDFYDNGMKVIDVADDNLKI